MEHWYKNKKYSIIQDSYCDTVIHCYIGQVKNTLMKINKTACYIPEWFEVGENCTQSRYEIDEAELQFTIKIEFLIHAKVR